MQIQNLFHRMMHTPDSNKSGVWLGKDYETRKQVVLSATELSQHEFVIGGTGTGKTTTNRTFSDFAMRSKLTLLAMDGKGDTDDVAHMKKMAEKYDRPFKAFVLGDPEQSANYNPLVIGNSTELKDRLITLSEWTEPHYQNIAERYLQIAFTLHMRADHKAMDLPNLVYYGLEPSILVELANKTNAPSYIKAYLSNVDVRAIEGLINRLAIMAESSIGHLFSGQSENVIVIRDVIHQGGVAFFSLDSLSYPLYAPLIGRLVINDIKAAASRHRVSDGLVMTIYDEFNVFASKSVVDFVNKSRSKGFSSLIATQSLADLDAVDPSLKNQIIQNSNTIIIHRQNNPEDAEQLAKVIGMTDVRDIVRHHDTQVDSERSSTRIIKDYMVQPDQLKRLDVGQAFVVRKHPKFQLHFTKIRNTEL